MKATPFFLIALFSALSGVTLSGFEADRKNLLTFEPITAKFVRLELTSTGEAPGIDELEIFGPESPETNLATTNGAKATASSCISGYPIHQIKHLIDGKFGNDYSWIADPTDSKPVVRIELPEPMLIDTVIFSRDLYGVYKDRVPAEIVLSVSQDGKDFRNIEANWSLRPSPFGPPRPLSRWATVHVPVVPPVQARGGSAVVNPTLFESEWLSTLVDEEYAWLKTYGYADIDPGLTNTPYPQQRHPLRKADDITTLVRLHNAPDAYGDDLSKLVSRGVVRVASPGRFEEGAASFYEIEPFLNGDNLYVSITSERFLSSHIAVIQTVASSGVIALNETGKPVWRIYNSSNQPNDTLLKTWGNDEQNIIRFIIPLSFLSDIEHGLAIRAGIGGRYTPNIGHPVYFYLSDIAVMPVKTDKSEDATFRVRFINHGDTEKEINGPGENIWLLPPGEKVEIQVEADNRNIGPERSLSFSIPADSIEGQLQLLRYSPAERSFRLFEEMIDRLCFETSTSEQNRHLDLAIQKRDEFATKLSWGTVDRKLFREIRRAKRELFFTDPGMEELSSILFEKRHPLHPTHNYSDYYDSTWRAGGGIYRLDIPKIQGRFVPEEAKVTELFQTTGMSRHPVADFDLTKIYFTNRPAQSEYWHIMEMNPDGSDLRQLTNGPFQDLWPCPLPDGDLAFISTRCKQKFLCWEPQASVLFRMNKNGEKMERLSFANLTEFAPSVARDGRILWTRSEYLDKGADYGHTLWYIRPDGTIPELTFGNTITLPQGYTNGREIPGSNEISCTMISHFGDLNGPVAILDIDQGRLNPDAITSITPEVPWPGFWARCETFREPFPLSKNIFLVSHASREQFALFVIDRFGNRELLSIDSSPERFGSMCPTPLRPRERPPVLPSGINPTLAEEGRGIFMVEDVYKGIDHVVPRGSAKYIRVCQEMPHFLEKNDDGTYRSSYQPFMEFYASPVDLVSGPYGWTSYVAKGDHGTVEVEEDGSAIFYAPANSVLFFELLDENYNEIQRMRSVVQLLPGESRSCVGCHEDRTLVPERRRRTASQQTPRELTPPPWGVGAFDYQKVVQPVLDKNCISCHDETNTVNLTGTLDTNFIPASFTTMIRGGYVHHFHWGYQAGVPTKAEPYTFGTMQSTLWSILNDENHQLVSLNTEEERAFKTWVDLSCPLWPDYTQRSLRNNPKAHDGTTTEQ